MSYIPTAYRVLLLLKLFIKHRTITFAFFQQAIEPSLPKSTDSIPRNVGGTDDEWVSQQPTETLSLSVFRKYVKTLRFVGCQIKTVTQTKATGVAGAKNQAYQLERHPFSWQPTQSDWLLFTQLFAHASETERTVLAPLVWSLSPSIANQFNTSLQITHQLPFEKQIPSFLRTAFCKKLQQCIKQIELIQQTGEGILLSLKHEAVLETASPVATGSRATLFRTMPLLCGRVQQLELKTEGTLQVVVEDVCTYQQYIVPLMSIESVQSIPLEQLLPLSPQLDAGVVQFKILDKLVAGYEKRANERIVETHYHLTTDTVDYLMIEATNVDKTQLFLRLKRYGQYAELISPLAWRQQFTNQLRQQLAQITP
jgi:hypothetical protein